jgi:hypothetical protein
MLLGQPTDEAALYKAMPRTYVVFAEPGRLLGNDGSLARASVWPI